MRLLICVTLLLLSQTRADLEDTICIRNIKFTKEIVKDSIYNPYQMVIDYDTQTLFFSYTVEAREDSSDVFKSAYLNLKTNEYNTIPGIIGGFAAAVDKKKHQVYLGGRDGIHEYNYATHEANRTDPDERSVWQMFCKDKLYYTTYPEEVAYIFNGTNSYRVPGLEKTRALLIAVDNSNTIYFSNSSGLFRYKDEVLSLGEYNLNSFTGDINNNLYFSTPEGFYSIDDQTVTKLANVDNVYGLVVEGDNNYIYAAENEIIRLKPTKEPCGDSEKKLRNRTK